MWYLANKLAQTFISVAYASTPDEIITKVRKEVLQPFVTALFVLATVVFLWGIIEFILNADNEEKRAKGKRHMIWGIVGLLIMSATGAIMIILYNLIAG